MAKASDIQRDLNALKTDVEKLRTHTADLVTKVADVGKDTVDSAMCNSKKAVKDAANTIRKNPIMAMASAVGAGLLLGKILKGLFRRR